MLPAISLTGVTKSFGSKVAVADLDLNIQQGALYGFIGPNGAGKTTTLRMIMSILFPDRGEITVLGRRSALEAKDRIGYLPEERGVYRKMKVGAFLTYMARLKSAQEDELDSRVRQWLERVELRDVYDRKCEELSKGMLQKVQLIAAVLHQPDLLVLDEPFSGLDPVNTRLLRELIRTEHRRGATILFSTHIMTQAEELCDHIVMLHRGRKVLDDSRDAIRDHRNSRSIILEPLDPLPDLTVLQRVPGVTAVSARDGIYQLDLADWSDPVTTLRTVASVVRPARIELMRPTLEDVFVGLVSDSAPGEEFGA